MPWPPIQSLLLQVPASGAGASEGLAPQRMLGGVGLLLVVVLLLALPLLVALRSAARRRRTVRAPSPTPSVDAWSESARRLKDSA